MPLTPEQLSQITQVAKSYYDTRIKALRDNKDPKQFPEVTSQNKGWLGALWGTLILPIVGTVIGALVGKYKYESNDAIKARKKIEWNTAQFELNKAKELGAKGEELQPYLEKVERTKVLYEEYDKERSILGKHKTTTGLGAGTVAAIALFVVATIFFPQAAIAELIFTAVPLLGASVGAASFRYDKKNTQAKAEQAAKAVTVPDPAADKSRTLAAAQVSAPSVSASNASAVEQNTPGVNAAAANAGGDTQNMASILAKASDARTLESLRQFVINNPTESAQLLTQAAQLAAQRQGQGTGGRDGL